jgi:H+/Cl- antiporter ClcA
MEHVDITNLIVVAVVMGVMGPAYRRCAAAAGARRRSRNRHWRDCRAAGLGWVHAGLVMNFLADFGLGTLFLMAEFEIEPNVQPGAPIRNAITDWFMSPLW